MADAQVLDILAIECTNVGPMDATSLGLIENEIGLLRCNGLQWLGLGEVPGLERAGLVKECPGRFV